MRLVLLTRRFWPLVGGAESFLARLAEEWQTTGHEVTVLTARWQTDWPAEQKHRGVRVVRLSQPRARWIGTLRYMQEVARWLRRNRGAFDLVYASMLKHGAYAAIGAARRGKFPVVLRAEGAGLTGDVHWQLDARCGYRIRRQTNRADALVAPSPAIEQELIAAGFPRDRIHQIVNGVPLPPDRTIDAQRESRRRLAQIDAGLAAEETTPVCAYTGRFHPGKGLLELIEAWRSVANRRPDARLWLIGEGDQREELEAKVAELRLSGKVILAGPLDDVTDVLTAADLFAFPSHVEGLSLSLLEAMAAELPVVASDIPGNRLVVSHEQNGLLFEKGNAAELGTAIHRLLDDLKYARRLAGAARETVGVKYALDLVAEQHLDLFREVLAGREQEPL